jgi:hypothetical protein
MHSQTSISQSENWLQIFRLDFGKGHFLLRAFFIITLYGFFALSSLAEEVNWEYFNDKEGLYPEVGQILSENPDFQKLDKNNFNFGFQNNGIWFRFSSESEYIGDKLFLNNGVLGIVDFFIVENEKVIDSVLTGTYRPAATRQIDHPNFVFHIPANMKGKQILLHVKSEEDIHGTLDLMSESDFEKASFNNYLYSIVPLSIIFTLTLLYIVIFISLKDEIYLTYLLYAFSVFMSVLRINGLGFYLFWPENPDFNHYSALFDAWPALTGGVFTAYFLRMKRFTPLIFKIVMTMVALQALAMVVCLSGYNSLAFQIVDLVATLFMPLAIGTGIYVYFVKKYEAALYYLISWAFLLTGVIIFLGRNYGLISADMVWMNHSLEIGIAGEMILLSIGVSQRIDLLRKEKITVQEQMNKIIRDQNTDLELKVNERTKILEEQNKEIIAQQEEIKSMNDRLEEIIKTRTKKLEKKNKLLTDYAYFNAHKVRGPLARILGLINLYNDGHKEEVEFLFNNIEVSAKELDMVIKEINKSLTEEEQEFLEIIEARLSDGNKKQT